MNVLEAQLHEEVLVGRRGEPYASQTLLGWAIIGPLNRGILADVIVYMLLICIGLCLQKEKC